MKIPSWFNQNRFTSHFRITASEKTFRTTANSLRFVLVLAAVLGMGGGVAFAQEPQDGPRVQPAHWRLTAWRPIAIAPGQDVW